MARTFAVADVYFPSRVRTLEAHRLDREGPGMVGVEFTDANGEVVVFALPATMARELAGSIVDELVALDAPASLERGVGRDSGGDA